MKCRLFRRRLLTQQMGQLPKFRFNTHFPPFSSIALDYFVPVKIKKTKNVTIDASIIQMTCITTRVVHLKITETQSTRTSYWPGEDLCPSVVYILPVFSDSAKTFFGAQKSIRDGYPTGIKQKLSLFLQIKVLISNLCGNLMFHTQAT